MKQVEDQFKCARAEIEERGGGRQRIVVTQIRIKLIKRV